MVNKKKRDELADLEKQRLLNPERLEEKRKQKKKRILFAVLSGAALFCFLLFAAFEMVRAVGKNSLKSKAEAAVPDMMPIMAATMREEETQWQEGWVRYQDKIYAYNEEILTFLIMGIDKKGEAGEVEEGTDGGQADALFLAVMNPKQKSIQIIGINRNTMADVDIYSEEGAYVTARKAQIAVQHGFGNGMEESCEYQLKAVSRFFYNLPIHGYAAVNMDAIPIINDAVGGVDVTVLEDLSREDEELAKGARVHLMGKTAFTYVKYRNTGVFGSADMRLERQKQYLVALIKAAKEAAGKDIGIVVKLYQAVVPMMVTDITADEAAYLAPIIMDYSFEDSFYMVKGETVMGEKYEEFYADEKALYEMILEIFYEPVEGDSE